jgi:hypothetical protein
MSTSSSSHNWICRFRVIDDIESARYNNIVERRHLHDASLGADVEKSKLPSFLGKADHVDCCLATLRIALPSALMVSSPRFQDATSTTSSAQGHRRGRSTLHQKVHTIHPRWFTTGKTRRRYATACTLKRRRAWRRSWNT